MVSDREKKQKYEIPTICTRPYYANKAHISGNDGNLSLSVPIVPLAILMALTMFECTDRPISYINGINDVETIAEHFAAHFSRACTSNSTVGADRLKKEYLRLKHSYTVNSRTGQTPQRIFVDSLKNADLRKGMPFLPQLYSSHCD